ncbi:MAG TPA: adenylate/guanylate cyclase domain-containing protein [Geminicoccaceae bacterium]
MRCSGCGFDNPEGARFCAGCGARLAHTCPACGFAVQADHHYCAACGHRLASAPAPALTPVAGERRQVTVLFCDLVGYTQLSRQMDAEEVHGLLERFFARVDGIVQSFGGTVDKHMGDCVMAVFGAPVAHGNDPERAARAALAIRDAMPQLSAQVGRTVAVHIGLASGQVVASGTGSETHRTYTVTGDSVNLASRLTDRAGGGEILISDAVRRLLPSRFVCNEAGALEVKGLSVPVTAWRLSGLGEEAEPPGRPFVGRRAELAEFDGVLRGCLETGAGQAVHIRGEAGIGKTRLLEEFQRRAAARGFTSHTGLVLDFGTATGQDAIRALVRSLLRLRAGSDAEARQSALERVVAADQAFVDRRVYLSDLLDLPQPSELRALYDAMDNATRGRGMRETVAALVRDATLVSPVLLAVEDVHWADQATLDHLASLADVAADCRAILAMTSRVEGDPLDHAWRTRIGGSPLMTIDLGPLRPPEATALAEAYLEASSQFARQCIERAAGNPLFLEQLLCHAEGKADAAVPGSVQSLVQARLDHLSAQDKQAAQAAAVFGQRFALDALRHLLQEPKYSCAALVERFLVRPAGDGFLFSHALIRDAVYDTLLRTRRRELHRRAAIWFAERDLTLHAEHLDRAEDPGAPAAYLAAAREQAGEYRYEQARALVDRGLALATVAGERFALTCLQGELLEHLGAMTESLRAYQAALEAAQDGAERCRALLGIAAVKRVIDDLDGAFADLEQAEASATRLGLTLELARLHFLRGNLYFPRGQIDRCLAEHQRSLDLARMAGSAELEAQALGGLGDAEYVRGRMLTAGRHFRACIALCRQHGFGRIEVASLPMAAVTALYAGQYERALQEATGAVEAASRVGHQRAEMIARHIVFMCHAERGEFAEARTNVERAIALARQLGARRFEAEGLGFLAAVEAASGHRSRAARLVRDALAISRETGMAYFGPGLLGWLALHTDDAEERRAALAEGEALLVAGSVSHNYFFFYQAAIETALNVRDWDAAERYAAALEDFTRPEPLPWIDLCIARGRALAAWGRGERDPAAIERLQALRDQAERAGLRSALVAIEAALGAHGSPTLAPV